LPSADEAMRLPEWLWGRADGRVDDEPLAAARQAEEAADLARRIARAATALRAADRRVAAAARSFADLAALAPESWADVRGDGSEADAGLALAAAMLRALFDTPVETLGSDPALTAALQLGRAGREIERARALASGIVARGAYLRHSRAAAETGRARLMAELAGLTEAVASSPALALPSTQVVSRAEDLLAQAGSELDRVAPDPSIARAMLQQAEEVLESLPGWDVRSARRLRLRALRRDAEAMVQRAGDYQDHHHGDVGRRALRRLAEALEARRAARRSLPAGGVEGLRAWLRVAAIAEDALAIARADVARADARRPEWAPREQWAGPIAPPPSPPRRAPFPGRFGDWGEARDPGRPPRQGRWGGRPSADANEGAATARLAAPGW
jgi:hypothetical protein